MVSALIILLLLFIYSNHALTRFCSASRFINMRRKKIIALSWSLTSRRAVDGDAREIEISIDSKHLVQLLLIHCADAEFLE